MGLQFEIVSDVYVAGRTEDGERYTAEVYYVQAEDERGNRWAHYAHFKGCETGYDEEYGIPTFKDVRPEAMAQAQHLLDRIVEAGGILDLNHWTETRPCYGSAAYQEYGQFNDWMEDEYDRLGIPR